MAAGGVTNTPSAIFGCGYGASETTPQQAHGETSFQPKWMS